MSQNADLVVKGGPLWAGPGRYWPQGVVEVRAGKVAFAGPEEAYTVCPAVWTLDAQGGLIMPGLLNAHCHAAMVLFRGLSDDLALTDWLFKVMFPAEARWVNEDMVELCTLLAAAEMLLSGTTCVGDAYFCAGGAMRAYAQAGMRAQVAQGVIDFPAPGVPDPGKRLEAAREFLETWQGQEPLVEPALFAHSLGTCSPETLRGVADLAREFKVPWYTHLAETRQEAEEARRVHGQSGARHLESLGVLDSLKAAVHGIWLEDEEIALLARRGVDIVHCPESNMKLASGAGDVRKWLAAGIKVALGTDGAASNNDLDMIAEVGTAARLAKVVTGDPAELPAGQALDMALSGSAHALGLEGLAGRLEPGFFADLIVINTNAPHLTPLNDVPSAVAYQARGGDVRHVVVNGKLVVQDRKVLTFDLDAVTAEVRSLAEKVAGAK